MGSSVGRVSGFVGRSGEWVGGQAYIAGGDGGGRGGTLWSAARGERDHTNDDGWVDGWVGEWVGG